MVVRQPEARMVSAVVSVYERTTIVISCSSQSSVERIGDMT